MNSDVKRLINTIKSTEGIDKGAYLKELKSNLIKFADYFNYVVNMEIFSNTITEFSASNEYMLREMDRERRDLHDLCIYACENINNMCDIFGVSHICPDDTQDRHAVAEFVGKIAISIFNDGIDTKHKQWTT